MLSPPHGSFKGQPPACPRHTCRLELQGELARGGTQLYRGAVHGARFMSCTVVYMFTCRDIWLL